jgi:hypothetical protein
MIEAFLSLARWLLTPMAFFFPTCIDHLAMFIVTFVVVYPSSLAHQSSPEQSASNLIYDRRVSVRPMDLNALLFYARMMTEGRTC